MDTKIRVGAVSYLNTKPLVYGFNDPAIKDQFDIIYDYPARIAAKLLNDSIDIGLLPVAVIPQLNEAWIVSDYCIGASNPVASVCVFSDVPLEKITKILVDYQSRTSAALLKVLLKELWKISPELIDTSEEFQERIGGTTAGLLIGDRALIQRAKSAYIYDLAEEWRELTNLPFVFAAWVANKKIPEVNIEIFNRATGEGLNHIPEIVQQLSFPEYDLQHYYTFNIDYVLDADKKKAIKLFHEKLLQLPF